MGVGLQADHQGDRNGRNIDADVLLLAVIEQVELVGLQPVHVVSVMIEDQHRRLYHLDAAGEFEGRLVRVLLRWLLSLRFRRLLLRRLGNHKAAHKGKKYWSNHAAPVMRARYGLSVVRARVV